MDVRPIHQLSAALVNRIAAGEVIERPASVVKELIENAIDAGARHITVEVEDGGLGLVRVIDDGCGIQPSDLPLAFAEHATSKLLADEDLFRIATMGFRGEALASIGAVSHARILSRVEANDAACEIVNRGGAISDPQAAAGNVGTTVEVRNLFYNTPARRKFLRGPSTEFGHISETVLRLSLPHPQIAFKLTHNNRTTLTLDASDAQERLLAAWPDEFRQQRLPIDVADAEVRLHGMIGLPELARPTAKYQQLYLNGRSIRDKFIQHALKEAYRGLTEPGRQPAAILMLDMPPQDVDVNVHPTKMEVRFRDSGRIHGLVLSAVRERLLGSDLTPNAVAKQTPAEDAKREDLRTKLAAFFKQQVPNSPPPRPLELQAPPPAAARLDFATRESSGSGTQSLEADQRPNGQDANDATPGTVQLFNRSTVQPTDERPPTYSPPPPPGQGKGAGSVLGPGPQAPEPSSRPSAIQLHNSYLVAESEDGLLIIDQHALHERIMYEDLRARLSRGPLESQRLLIPQAFDASPRQMALLDQIQPLLERLGIEVCPFGPTSLAVQAFPSFLQKLEPARFVQELLERGEQELLDLHDEELLHEVLDMMACKAAVKAGDPLTTAEIEALLARRDLVARSSNCPHGRPTTLRLTLRDLEKQFKRTGF